MAGYCGVAGGAAHESGDEGGPRLLVQVSADAGIRAWEIRASAAGSEVRCGIEAGQLACGTGHRLLCAGRHGATRFLPDGLAALSFQDYPTADRPGRRRI